MFGYAPGRVNIIGEHIDYNNGYIMPFAIDLKTKVKIKQSRDNFFHINSNGFHEEIFKPGKLENESSWADYVKGSIWVLQEKFKRFFPPVELEISSDVPLGAGLSSSAAVEVATIKAFSGFFNLKLETEDFYFLAQKAENEFVGVKCGIMDQFTSVMGKKDYALFLDIDNMKFEYIPLEIGDFSFIIINTNVKHSLGSGEYNVRRNQCQEALFILGKKSFRELSVDYLYNNCEIIDNLLLKRSLHVVSEIQRVLECKKAFEEKNLYKAGALLFQTHESLRDNYEVSCEEADFLVDNLMDLPEISGARIMGGGFGGSVIALGQFKEASEKLFLLQKKYFDRFEIKADLFHVYPSQGAGFEN